MNYVLECCAEFVDESICLSCHEQDPCWDTCSVSLIIRFIAFFWWRIAQYTIIMTFRSETQRLFPQDIWCLKSRPLANALIGGCAASIQELSLAPHRGLHCIQKRASKVAASLLQGHTTPPTISRQINFIAYTEEYLRLRLCMSSIGQQGFIKKYCFSMPMTWHFCYRMN